MSTSHTVEGMNSKTTLADGAPMASRPETPTGPGTPKTLDGGAMSIAESTTTKTDVEPMKQPTLLVGRRLFLVFMYAVMSSQRSNTDEWFQRFPSIFPIDSTRPDHRGHRATTDRIGLRWFVHRPK